MKLSPRIKIGLFIILSVIVGIMIGGFIFSDVRPRLFFAVRDCDRTCLAPEDITGLLASIGIQKFPGIIPAVVKESEKTIVVKHPFPEGRIHYVFLPKKDIKNIADISEEDRQYLIDLFDILGEIIRRERIADYVVATNGPGIQQVTYLHFHLVAK